MSATAIPDPRPAAQTAPPTASATPSAATVSATVSSTSLRLARGEIPSTWTKPAEFVSSLPQPAPRPALSGAIVGLGVLACVALALVLAPRRSPPAPEPPMTTASAPAPVAAVADVERGLHVVPMPPADPAPAPSAPTLVASAPVAIPPPPSTSSTKVEAVAPEDQGGDPVAHTAPDASELPARTKAKSLTAKAITALKAADYAGAEPNLVRAVLADPTYADAWRHLGIARAQLGDKDGARRAYRKYLALAPTAPDAPQVKAILAQP